MGGGGAGPSLSSASTSRSEPRGLRDTRLDTSPRIRPGDLVTEVAGSSSSRHGVPEKMQEGRGVSKMSPERGELGCGGGAAAAPQSGAPLAFVFKRTGDHFVPHGGPQGGAPTAWDQVPWRLVQRRHHRGAGGRAGSDGEGDEAVVALDVALEDLGAGAQHALETGPVQLHALEGTAGHHGGRPGPVQEQRDLPCGAEGGQGLAGAWLPIREKQPKTQDPGWQLTSMNP